MHSGSSTGGASPAPAEVVVPPMDEHNRELVENVHPAGWVNPEPSGRYNLVVVGAGTAGLVSTAIAAALGAKVAIIERHLLGGDCLNTGCVPSKAMIRSARAIADVRNAGAFGVRVPPGVEADFGRVMERMRRVRARISHHDSARRFASLGADVFIGQAEFVDPHTVRVGEKELQFTKAVIATGARAATPPIGGIEDVGFLTSETVFHLTERPRRLAVIGAGPIGVELAQTFRRLGTDVTLIEKAERILVREDEDAARVVQAAFEREGVRLVLGASVERVERDGGDRVLHLDVAGRADTIRADEILVGVGRAPNVDGLNLEAAGVRYEATGIDVDEFLQTSARHIYAAGDICMRHKFTHAADAAARIVVRNALVPLPGARQSALVMPWCTYTDPEVAHVGLGERDARERGVAIDTYVKPFSEVDRALADGEDDGFVKVHVRKGTGKIVGATIVARHAGDMISEITLAMVAGVGLGKIGDVIHPYPTRAEAIRAVAGLYMKSRFTPFWQKVFTWWMRRVR